MLGLIPHGVKKGSQGVEKDSKGVGKFLKVLESVSIILGRVRKVL